MGVVTVESKAQAIVRLAIKHTLEGGAIDFDGDASTASLARLAERASFVQKGEPPENTQELMLAVLRYADYCAGLKGSAHVYDQYRYEMDGIQGTLRKTCTINFYFWTEETTKGGA